MLHAAMREVRPTLKLAFPLIIAFLGYQLISLVDTFVAGHIGVNTLAAVSLGSALFWVMTIFPLGLLMGLDPILSQALGAHLPRLAWRACRRGAGLALILSLFFGPLLWLSAQEGWPWSPEGAVSEGLWYYTAGRVWCVPLLLLHVCLRCFLQAHEQGRVILLGTLMSNVLNLVLSVYLGGGDALSVELGGPSLGWLPEGLGALGIGLASSLVLLIEIGLLAWFARQIGVQSGEDPNPPPLLGAWKKLVILGSPIGGAMLSEGGVFSASTLIVSAWSPVVIGAHQVTLQLASATFTICLGIASATSVRVGLAVGAEDFQRARGAGIVGLVISLVVMCVSALSFIFYGHRFAGLLSLNHEVIKLSAELLVIAAAFQLFDGVQVTTAAALRGAGFTRIQLISAIVSHWGVGLPLSLYFAFKLSMGVQGLWWGLCCGLICASLILARSFFGRDDLSGGELRQ